MKIYENIEIERARIGACIKKFGWTSDHNLDWFCDSIIDKEAKPVFVEFDDGSGLLAHYYPHKWRIWSDPLCRKEDAVQKISEFAEFILKDPIQELWCDDVSDKIYPELKNRVGLKLNDIYYNLYWPVLDMSKYDPALPGGHSKDIRNAKNKFYREHRVEIINAGDADKKLLHQIVEDWKSASLDRQKEDLYELKYHKAIDNNFKAFITARVLMADGKPVGFNAGYEVSNMPDRFAGIIGIHNYSSSDLGTILWLEDLDWVKKNSKYKFYDMQGSEEGGGLKQKMRFGAVIERKTDTFSIAKK